MSSDNVSAMIASLRKQGNLGEALKKAREARHDSGRVELPEGNYVCKVAAAKLVPGDKPRVVWNLVVDRGAQAGKTIPFRFDLYQRSWKDRNTHETVTYTLVDAFNDASITLQKVGVSPSDLPESDAAAFIGVMLDFPSRKTLVSVTLKKKGDFMNVYVNRKVEDIPADGKTTHLLTESSADDSPPFEPSDENGVAIETDDVVRYKAEGDQRATRWVVTETDNVVKVCALQEIAGRRRTLDQVPWDEVEPMMA